MNVILVSPRRIGKSSIVRKVKSEITNPAIKVVLMDVYDCRSEYDFYNRFASVLMKETASKAEQVLENIKRFLVRLTPKISFTPEPMEDFSFSLGITPENYKPEEILQLPELIAKEKGIHIVVCIDEFQQIGEFPLDGGVGDFRLHLSDDGTFAYPSRRHEYNVHAILPVWGDVLLGKNTNGRLDSFYLLTF